MREWQKRVSINASISYGIDDLRRSYPLNAEFLEATAELWTENRVARWFGVDNTRLFIYVPQLVTYQPGRIQVSEDDFEDPGNA